MRTRPLGPSGLDVGAIGLGAMPLSLGAHPTEADAVRVIHAALDAGMTLIDTADAYCHDHTDIGHNERLVRLALASWPRRDGVVVATKGGLERPNGAWISNGHPGHLRWACEQSLKALAVERIDLYQLHVVDPRYPLEDSVGELARLHAEGKIANVGLSNVSVPEIERARALVPIASVQNRMSPIDRQPLHDGVLAYCEQHGLAFLAYSPVGGSYGVRRVAHHAVLCHVAASHGATPHEIALAWLLAKSPSIIPIPGASRVESAVSSARAAEIALTEQEIRVIDAS
ncbi:MAG: aldo/keto reductase [Myxococcales bacterium]|nr:aldo/keto reductase [Myxococcales bacterium]MCB9735781.1 aldo/keto reductase [Deltaproteobacteria bacterium]